jgi:hypothetical protein
MELPVGRRDGDGVAGESCDMLTIGSKTVTDQCPRAVSQRNPIANGLRIALTLTFPFVQLKPTFPRRKWNIIPLAGSDGREASLRSDSR